MLPSIRKFWTHVGHTGHFLPLAKATKEPSAEDDRPGLQTRSGLFLCQLAMLFHFGIGLMSSQGKAPVDNARVPKLGM